jgi:UDP-N-acetylmuramoyl-L-alanyl-D-glutamate--2,6-diaminopimelate ligase
MLEKGTFFSVTCHTGHVGQGSIFVAIQGQKENGIAYISQALAKGATMIVVDQHAVISDDLLIAIEQAGATVSKVANTRLALAQLSAQAAGYPVDRLKIIGITGTKGKTSTAFILEHILRSAGCKTALLGTVKNNINGQDLEAHLTTPQPDYLHQFFKLCVEQGVDYVVMEVAAQAVTLHRVEGIQFEGIIFTNFGAEHAEFYATLDDYFAAKVALFKQLKPGALCLINGDDQKGKQILDAHKNFQAFAFVAREGALSAVTFSLIWQDKKYEFVCPALIGTFNGYNLTAAVRMALNCGVTPEKIQAALETFKGVPGRLESYQLPNGALGIIDYAHNPSSFNAILSTLRGMADHLIVVFGAGGERDATKRPVMGTLAAEYADCVILTSDNPRSENPAHIAAAIYRGIPEHLRANVMQELDRESAIKLAYARAKKGSIIALLGKGPDEYQQIGAIKYPFSEKSILNDLGNV